MPRVGCHKICYGTAEMSTSDHSLSSATPQTPQDTGPPRSTSGRKVATRTLIVFTIVGALFLGFGWGKSAERDVATSSTTSPTTTSLTQPVSTTVSVNSVTAGLMLALEPDTVATLRNLAESYEAVDRALDSTAEAALIAVGVVFVSGGQARADNMIETMSGTFDEYDVAIWALSNEVRGQLLEQLDPFARDATDRYLSALRVFVG